MARCMICGKERAEEELRGRICRACGEQVRRDASETKLREKRASDRALRGSGERPESPKRES